MDAINRIRPYLTASIIDRMRRRTEGLTAQPRPAEPPVPAWAQKVRALRTLGELLYRVDDAAEAKRRERRRWEKLAPRERHVLREREFGRSFGQIASDEAMRKPDGACPSRQRIKQLEQRARRKLGLGGSVAATVHAEQQAGRGAGLRAKGRRVNFADLHTACA